MALQGIPSIIGAGIRSSAPAFNAGFDFRATAGYVTDVAPNTYVLASDTYPTSRGGFTFGWESTTGLDSRDRSTGVDSRLAGINFKPNSDTVTDTFRVDLPLAGTYNIRLALGDGTTSAQTNYVVVKDTSTALITFAPIATGGNFADAAGNLWSPANWPANNVAVSEAFATTILRIVIGGTVDSLSSCIAYLAVYS